jgi:hypothetical protein
MSDALKTSAQKCITILTSVSAEDAIVAELDALGVRGCSVSDARGRGEHGPRPGKWASGNIRVEVVVSAAMLERLVPMLERHRKSTVLVAWISDVQAYPAEKFLD